MAAPELAVRAATPKDVPTLKSFDELLSRDGRREALVANAISAGRCWVAETRSTVLGYGALTAEFFNREFVALVIVAASNRRQGVATAILDAMEATCAGETVFTSTNESNLPMRRLLAKRGYQPSGRIENLDTGDPELVFMKVLRNRAR
jgi:GNAT superfamily N-acetyltransferase